jgi:hypothetical protein
VPMQWNGAARLQPHQVRQPSAAKRSGRNAFPDPVGIQGTPSVSRGRAGSKVRGRMIPPIWTVLENATASPD